MSLRASIAIVLLAQATAWSQSASADPEVPALAPYQLVRSLQIAQDRIADGDHAVLPMQKKMIEMIDERLREARPDEFADRRNFEALVIYGMSGGNPETLETVAARLSLDPHDAALTGGLVAYFKSNPGRATSLLTPLDPAKETPQIGAFLALVKGTIIALQHPEKGLALLDLARLYAPGTLIEEAALRRSISIAASIGDRARFLKASEQYTRRFLRSPYASHFADGFINGATALRDGLDLQAVEEIVSAMNAEQQLAIYLRIARKSAIAGYTDLAEFASAKARLVSGSPEGPQDPRAAFYNALASVTTQPIEEVARRLDAIDRSTLAKQDIRLLDAAREVVRSVMASPLEPSGERIADAPTTAVRAGAAGDRTVASPAVQEAAEQQPVPPDGAVAGDGAAPAESAPAESAVAASSTAAPDRQPEPPADTGAIAGQPSLDDIVSSTRKTLQDIDDLLKKEEE